MGESANWSRRIVAAGRGECQRGASALRDASEQAFEQLVFCTRLNHPKGPEQALARSIVVVVGAGSGIGKAVAHRLARE